MSRVPDQPTAGPSDRVAAVPLPIHPDERAPAGPARPSAPAAPNARDSDWVGLGEASRMLGISQGTLRRWADEGRVAVFTTPGGHRRFSRRLLRSLLPATRAHRPSLERLGASTERIARAYRPGRMHVAGEAAFGWLDTLEEADRLSFRERGLAIVAALLAHLDASDADTRGLRLQDACRLSAEHGRQAAAHGVSMADAVQTFLQFRSPFVGELAGLARQRGLDTREATELLAEADAAMDRLLVATMTGHSLAASRTRAAKARGR